ncbi:hypothetical protein ACFXKS_28495 [Streptomyces scopuliridis]|uniref:hypothetical protein n=1 Tax=Streptomyces scopuliridis TaxID=452529 RepID=UPI0036949B94
MKRRQLLQGALAVGLSGAPVAALATSRHAADQALTTTASGDLDNWEESVEEYSYGYRGRPPTDVLAGLAADIDGLRPMLDRPLPVPERTRLCRSAAQLAGMTAIVLHDLGDRSEAKRWFATAGKAAAESGDRSLHAWVLARHAMVPINFGPPRPPPNSRSRHDGSPAPIRPPLPLSAPPSPPAPTPSPAGTNRQRAPSPTPSGSPPGSARGSAPTPGSATASRRNTSTSRTPSPHSAQPAEPGRAKPGPSNSPPRPAA